MTHTLSKSERQQVEAAIAERRAHRGQCSTEQLNRWRDAGLLLWDSLDGRAPTYDESRLIRTAEQWHAINPAPGPLEDQATDAETRAKVTVWKTRDAQTDAKAGQAYQALLDRRAVVISDLEAKHPDQRDLLILSEALQETTGLRELELAAVRARAAASEVKRAFADWRLRMWCDGKLKSTKGT